MPLTRRTFLHSSLCAGLVAAADATLSPWLLSSESPLRIGMAGLGTAAFEHLAVFAAIPGAKIVGVTDSDPDRVRGALHQLRALNQSAPRVYGSLTSMLRDSTFQAISLSWRNDGAALELSEILIAKLPVLMDFPPAMELPRHRKVFDTASAARTAIQFRLPDYIYPASNEDLASWLRRNMTKPIEAGLLTSRIAAEQEFRMALISATDSLLAALDLSPHELLRWIGSNESRIGITNGGTLAHLGLPQNSHGLGALRIHLLGGPSPNANLLLRHIGGSIETPIFTQPDEYSSLQTAMRFLTFARLRDEASNPVALRSLAAAAFVDRFLKQTVALRLA